MNRTRPAPRLPALLLLCVGFAVQAQSPRQPLTGNMLGQARAPAPVQPTPAEAIPLDAAAPAAAATVPPADTAFPGDEAPTDTALPGDERIGSATRALLRLQASGQQAGRRLPVLGDQASASYARYLKSFEHPIPEFFENKVKDSSSN